MSDEQRPGDPPNDTPPPTPPAPEHDFEFEEVAIETLERAFEGEKFGVLDHPPGLFLLFVTEMWERFSYYGMRALLTLYMIAEISGNGVNGVGGGLGFDRENVGKIYGWYTSLVYLMPVFGGILADKLIGTHRSMLIGGIIIALGHGSLSLIDVFRADGGAISTGQSFAFYGGLALIIIGTGFFKPCVSVMVGQLYKDGDPRRDSGFTIFYMGINLGAFLAAIVCGTLATKFGWWAGFGAAGIGMVFGLIVYTIGRPKLLKGIGLPPKDHDPAVKVITKLLAAIVGLAIPIGIYAVLGHLGSNAVDARASWLGFADGLNQSTAEVIKLGYFLFLILAALGGIAWFIKIQEKHERGPTTALFIIAFFVVFFWYAFEQAGSSLNIFAQQRTDRAYSQVDTDGKIESGTIGEKWTGISETTMGKLHAKIGGSGGHGGGSHEERQAVIDARTNPFNMGAGTIHVTQRSGEAWSVDFVPETTVQELAALFADASGGTLELAENEDADGVVLTDSTEGNGLTVTDERGTAARNLRILSAKEFPAAWYQSVNALFILLFAPVFAIIWVVLGKRGSEPSTPAKMAYGLMMLGLGFVFLVLAGKFTDGSNFIAPGATETPDGSTQLARAAASWLVFAYLFHTWGELCLSPIGLSLTTKLAPRKWVSFMMGVWFLSPSIAQLIGGYTFAYIEPIETGEAAGFPIIGGQADFFLIFVITSIAAGVVLFLITPIMRKLIGGRG